MISALLAREQFPKQKADVGVRPKAYHHVGLLANEPPGPAELPFISSSETSISLSGRCCQSQVYGHGTLESPELYIHDVIDLI